MSISTSRGAITIKSELLQPGCFPRQWSIPIPDQVVAETTTSNLERSIRHFATLGLHHVELVIAVSKSSKLLGGRAKLPRKFTGMSCPGKNEFVPSWGVDLN